MGSLFKAEEVPGPNASIVLTLNRTPASCLAVLFREEVVLVSLPSVVDELFALHLRSVVVVSRLRGLSGTECTINRGQSLTSAGNRGSSGTALVLRR